MPTTLEERRTPMRFGARSADTPSGTGWIALALLVLLAALVVGAVVAIA